MNNENNVAIIDCNNVAPRLFGAGARLSEAAAAPRLSEVVRGKVVRGCCTKASCLEKKKIEKLKSHTTKRENKKGKNYPKMKITPNIPKTLE